jgi:alpha-1,3-mannosyltransferase
MPFQKWLLIADAAICVAILLSTGYTEIDWKAYMDEANGFFVHHELDYRALEGSTGPLVYPAGFTYIFSALSVYTDIGKNILLAQLIFFLVYIVLVALVLRIYRAANIPFLFTVVLILSKRMHSIFLLRMFNDCVCMLFFYASVVCFARRRPVLGCGLFSLAVSVKMNALLAAPGVLVVLMKTMNVGRVAGCLLWCAIIQVLLGLPFLMYDWTAYMSRAFEIGRVFTFKWSVNFKFLPEDVFVSKELGIALLFLTVYAMGAAYFLRWRKRDYSQPISIFLTIFESNIIGVVFCRSLHYQFYTWFFHQLPLVLSASCTHMPSLLKLIVIGAVEFAFNVYPSTPLSSAVLMLALFGTFLFILAGRDATVPPAAPLVPVSRHAAAGAKKKQ